MILTVKLSFVAADDAGRRPGTDVKRDARAGGGEAGASKWGDAAFGDFRFCPRRGGTGQGATQRAIEQSKETICFFGECGSWGYLFCAHGYGRAFVE